MAGIFDRIFKVGKAQAHAVIDKMEDPIKMTEQGIRDLKRDLQESLKSLAEVKALANRMKKEAEDNKKLAADYERKAMSLLQKAQAGELDPGEAEKLAKEAMIRKTEATKKAAEAQQNYENQQRMVDQMHANVERNKSSISSYENDLTTLKARAKTAAATRKINEQISRIDSSGTLAVLERMKNKVQEEESLAQAYGELASPEVSIDDEINKALSGPDMKLLEAEDSLAELKKKMGITSQ